MSWVYFFFCFYSVFSLNMGGTTHTTHNYKHYTHIWVNYIATTRTTTNKWQSTWQEEDLIYWRFLQPTSDDNNEQRVEKVFYFIYFYFVYFYTFLATNYNKLLNMPHDCCCCLSLSLYHYLHSNCSSSFFVCFLSSHFFIAFFCFNILFAVSLDELKYFVSNRHLT